MKYRFHSAQRLHTPNEFAAVLRRRGLIRGVCLELLSSDSNAPHPRLGLIVPKRLAKRAVLRNMIKRQARECFRLRAGELPARDFIVRLARPTRIEGVALKQALREDLQLLFGKILAQTAKAGNQGG